MAGVLGGGWVELKVGKWDRSGDWNCSWNRELAGGSRMCIMSEQQRLTWKWTGSGKERSVGALERDTPL